MEDVMTLLGKDFNFAELLCFALLWRIESTLKATTDAINKHLDVTDKEIRELRSDVRDVRVQLNKLTKE